LLRAALCAATCHPAKRNRLLARAALAFRDARILRRPLFQLAFPLKPLRDGPQQLKLTGAAQLQQRCKQLRRGALLASGSGGLRHGLLQVRNAHRRFSLREQQPVVVVPPLCAASAAGRHVSLVSTTLSQAPPCPVWASRQKFDEEVFFL